MLQSGAVSILLSITLIAVIIVFTSGVGIGCSFADSIHRSASLRYLLRYVACSRRSLGHVVALGHVDAMMPMSHWAMRTSSGSPIDQEQGCWIWLVMHNFKNFVLAFGDVFFSFRSWGYVQ